MKRFFSLLLLALFVSSASAVPAKKGIWKTLSFNGTEVRAQLIGDEHLHYWQTDEGLKFAFCGASF